METIEERANVIAVGIYSGWTQKEFEQMAEEHGKQHGGIRCLTRYPSYQDGGREYMQVLYMDGTYETRRA